MRALVTGGAGFIGSALVDRLLAEGHSVEVVDDLSTGAMANLAEARSGGGGLRFTKLDVTEAGFAALVAHRTPDVLYHLATPATWVDDAALDARQVIGSSLAVLEAARLGGAHKVVVALSDAVYGEPDALPVKESHPHRPLAHRGVAESAVAAYLAVYRERHGLEGTALVLPTVYGPRQRAGFVPSVVAGTPVAGACDLVFIDDAVDALARAADRAGGLVVNVGSGAATTAAAVASLLDCDLVTGPLRPGRPSRMALDAKRAKIHLGWEPFTSLADGLATLRA